MKELNKKNPFTTPTGYFDSVSDSISAKLFEEKSLGPKKEGFTLPDGYFDDVAEKIQRRLEPKTTKVVPLKTKSYYYWAAASVAALFILAFSWHQNVSQEPTWNTLAQNDIELYFEDHGLNLSAYEIAEEISLERLEVTDFVEHNLNDDTILEYLNENTDDFEDLNLEHYE